MSISLHTGRLRSFLAASSQGSALDDLGDPTALAACLSGIEESIVCARAEVLHVVNEQQAGVDDVLLHSVELRREINDLQRGASELSHASIQAQLQSGLLQLPSLRPQLHSSRTALELIDSLARLHRCLMSFEKAMVSNDLNAATEDARALRAAVEFVATQMKVMLGQCCSGVCGTPWPYLSPRWLSALKPHHSCAGHFHHLSRGHTLH